MVRHYARALAAVFVLGGGASEIATGPAPARAAEPAAKPGKPLMKPDPKGGIIKGKIVYDGPPPVRKRLKMNTTPYCDKHHKGEPPYEDSCIVNDDKTLRDVVVSVKSGLPKGKWEMPTEPAKLDQVGCVYTPHVVLMRTRQKLVVKNSDETMHNVHFLSRKNREKNFSQAKQGMEKTIKDLRRPEKIRVVCDIHPWMGAYICLFDQPFFTKTGKEGTYELKGLPPGKYKIEAWTERLKSQVKEVEVKAGATAELNFTFKPRK